MIRTLKDRKTRLQLSSPRRFDELPIYLALMARCLTSPASTRRQASCSTRAASLSARSRAAKQAHGANRAGAHLSSSRNVRLRQQGRQRGGAVARPDGHRQTRPAHRAAAWLRRAGCRLGQVKLVDIASILATGHEAGVIAQGETREEAEKRLSTLLMRGDLIIAIDNCEGPLEGVVFNQALTQQGSICASSASRKASGRGEALITATGNNLIIKGDLTRRSVVCRLDPKVERPELRQYAYDPIADAKDNRGELVVAVLTILRAYHVAGRPNRPPRLQSFEIWSDTVRGALMWLGAGDPAGTMNRLRRADPVLRT